MIASPPSFDGGDHDTLNEEVVASPTLVMIGALGTVAVDSALAYTVVWIAWFSTGSVQVKTIGFVDALVGVQENEPVRLFPLELVVKVEPEGSPSGYMVSVLPPSKSVQTTLNEIVFTPLATTV